MAAFEYRQAQEIRDAFLRHGVRYLFIGESGAILLGFSDTTQVANVFPDRSPENGRALVTALGELGFDLTGEQAAEIERGKALIQLKNGPFDLDLIFAPDGIGGSTMPGADILTSRVSPYAISTTSSPARPPLTVNAIESRFPDFARFANTGSNTSNHDQIG